MPIGRTQQCAHMRIFGTRIQRNNEIDKSFERIPKHPYFYITNQLFFSTKRKPPLTGTKMQKAHEIAHDFVCNPAITFMIFYATR